MKQMGSSESLELYTGQPCSGELMPEGGGGPGKGISETNSTRSDLSRARPSGGETRRGDMGRKSEQLLGQEEAVLKVWIRTL